MTPEYKKGDKIQTIGDIVRENLLDSIVDILANSGEFETYRVIAERILDKIEEEGK